MILFWLLFLFLRLPSLFEPYWYGDEGIYLTLGHAIRHGLTLYSQIHDNKPPLLYYLAALGHTVFGFRLLLLLVMIPTIFYFYKLANKFTNIKLSKILTFIFMIVTSIPFFEGTIANAEIFMLLPTILAFYHLLNKKYFLSGLMFGLAFVIKAPVIIEAIFAFLYIITVMRDKKIFAYLFGCLLPISIFGIYFFFKNAFKQFLISSILLNFGYLSSWKTGTMNNSLFSGALPKRGLVLFLAWIIIYILFKKKIINQKLCFLLAWFSATIFGSLLSARPYPHYLIQTLPPLILLISFLPYFLVALGFFILIIYQYNFSFFQVFPYYQNFYLQKNNPQYFSKNIATTYKVAEFIKNNTLKTEKIFIWGDEPYVYALSDRLPVGRYTVAYHIYDFNGYQETIDAINKNNPKFIIYYSTENRPFIALDKIINEKYILINQIGNALIFQKK